MHRRSFLTLAVLTPLAGCLEYFDENGEEITDPEDVEIDWHDLVRENPGTEDERVYIWGVAKNIGDRSIRYLEIRATFFDAEGEELDSVIENAEDLVEGSEWEFEIEYPHFGEAAAEVADYELELATGV